MRLHVGLDLPVQADAPGVLDLVDLPTVGTVGGEQQGSRMVRAALRETTSWCWSGGGENLALEYAARGVRPVALRFAPSVHGMGDHGFVRRW